MATIATGLTVEGSPARFTLTDIQPGRARPLSQVYTDGSIVSWVIPTIIGGVAGAIWGRSSAPNEAKQQAEADRIEAAVTKDEALAEKAEAEAEAIRAGLDRRQPLSPEVADDLARRRFGLDERRAEQLLDEFDKEAAFRELQRRAQTDIQTQRIRQAAFEADIKEAQEEELYQRSLTAAERSRLEVQKLELTNRTLRDLLIEREAARIGRAAAPELLPTRAPVTTIRAIGPGVAGGLALGARQT